MEPGDQSSQALFLSCHRHTLCEKRPHRPLGNKNLTLASQESKLQLMVGGRAPSTLEGGQQGLDLVMKHQGPELGSSQCSPPFADCS